MKERTRPVLFSLEKSRKEKYVESVEPVAKRLRVVDKEILEEQFYTFRRDLRQKQI